MLKTLLSLILLALGTAHGQVNYYYKPIAYRLPKPCIAMPNNIYVCSPFDKNYHEWRPYHGKHTRHNDSLGGGK